MPETGATVLAKLLWLSGMTTEDNSLSSAFALLTVLEEEGWALMPYTENFKKLEKLIVEEHHVIQFTDRGWTIAHPLKERLDDSLFECRLYWNDDDPGWRGRYWLLEDGSIGDPYEYNPYEGWEDEPE